MWEKRAKTFESKFNEICQNIPYSEVSIGLSVCLSVCLVASLFVSYYRHVFGDKDI